MRNTRQGSVAPNGGESLTLQQIVETMQALQETVVASRADQERIQIDLSASLARNKELQRANAKSDRGTRGGRARTCHATQGFPDAILASNHGRHDTNHVRGS